MKYGRKFVVVMFALVASTLLAAFGKLTGEYVTIVSVAVGAFCGANAYITGKSLPASGSESRA